MPTQAFPLVDADASINHKTHLSGMTLADFTKDPKIDILESIPFAPEQLESTDTTSTPSKRFSQASTSTTKSELRQTNSVLVEMLQNIQTELAAHRAILLNIQNRVTTLESDSTASSGTSLNEHTPHVTFHVPSGHNAALKRNSNRLAPEAAEWWRTCQNFASNAEPPISAREFLRTPHRFSGFDFKWGTIDTPPSSPPSVEDLPPLTPTSEHGESSGFGSPLDQNVFLGEEVASDPRIVGPVDDLEAGIKERTVEFDQRKLPAVPTLQPAPGAKPTLVRSETTVSATEPEFVEHSHRFFRGVRSLVTYKALLKQKSSGKGVYIGFFFFHYWANLD